MGDQNDLQVLEVSGFNHRGVTLLPRTGRIRMGDQVYKIYYPYDHRWTWKPLQKARRKYQRQSIMAEHRRSEVVLRNLAHELLSEEECRRFKQALHHFRVSRSVTTLCQQLKPLINNTEKILLLLELSSRIPQNLQEDFHRLCGLQYNNYETYFKIFTNGNSMNEIPRVIAQDSSGKFQVVSKGSHKKIHVNNLRNVPQEPSRPGSSVTSGVYSEYDEDDDDEDDKDHLNDYRLDDMTNEDDVFIWKEKYQRSRSASPHMLSMHRAKAIKSGSHRIFLERRLDGSLGLGIKGGKEYGTDITVYSVEKGGPAALQGLKFGDKILEVNGNTFADVTHAEAVTLMRNAWNIIMVVQSAPQLADDRKDVMKVIETELVVYPSQGGRLGCTTSRQVRNNDLLVKEVESNSAAQRAGITAGDHIIRIDGISLRDLTEKQITALTKSKRLMVCVKRVITNDIAFTPMNFKDTEDKNNDEFSPMESSSPRLLSVEHGETNEELPTAEKQRKFDEVDHMDTSNTKQNRPLPIVPVSHEKEIIPNHVEHSHQHHHTHTTNPLDHHTHTTNPLDHHTHTTNPLGPARSSHIVHSRPPPTQDGNWFLSQKPQHRYTPKRETHGHQNVAVVPGRSHSDGHAYGQAHGQVIHMERRSRSQGREPGWVIQNHGGVMRYVRSRSHSPHSTKHRTRHLDHDVDIIHAIQRGLEKRQRAIRLSLYQMPDTSDFEWEIS